MRFNLICCVVTYVILLVLLETSGAPSSDCAKEDERLISHTIEKENSKSSAKIKKEEIEDTESESCCKNGLVSGEKSITQSKELSEAEIEKSRLAEEKKTTKGTEKSETDVTKKKLVSVSEKKKLLVYYMVSYRKLPAKHEDESKVDYYKRVFPIEENQHVFLRKIFKCYEGEAPKDYIDRIEYIFCVVYPEKDCRLDPNFIDVIDHYYTLKYSRKIDETDECYFPRVLKKWPLESHEHYKKRMECLMKCLDEEDFCHIELVDNDVGYKIGVRKTPAKSRSSPSSSGENIGHITSSVKKSKEEKENMDASETSIKQRDQTSTSSEYQKNLKKRKMSVETEEKTKAFAYRVAYTKLPKKTPGELDEVYYKKFFGEYKNGMPEECRNELYMKMLIQYKGENCTEYCQRIDFLFDKVYPQMDIRTNKLLMGILDHYYQEKFKKCDKETDEDWFNRVLKKLPCETVQHFNDRVECLKITFEDIDWSKVIIDSKTGTFKLVSEKTSQTKDCSKDSKTTEDIKKTYAKRVGESDEAYFKRIVTTKISSTTDKYSATMEKVYQTYPDLPLWGDIKCMNIVKECYTKIYEKKQCESDDQYCKRFGKRYPFETDKQFCNRMFILHKLYPNLKIWTDDKYFPDYTKNIYLSWYKKTCADSSDEAYYKRIVTKCDGETQGTYAKRVEIIRKCYPNLPIWYEKEYFSMVKEYYTTAYSKQKGETEGSYYSRIVKRESWETSDEMWIKRVDIIHDCIATLPLWFDETYYEKYMKNYYDVFCRKLPSDSCDNDWYKRMTIMYPKETDEMYMKRMSLIQQHYSSLALWYNPDFSCYTKKFYTIMYTKKSSESDTELIQRIFRKWKCDTSTTIWSQRVHQIHELTASYSVWYNKEFYEKYLQAYYASYYKKDDKVSCVDWLTKTLCLLPGESEECAIKRIALIKMCTSSCGCWTADYFSKVKICNGISSTYYDLIKKSFFSCDVQYEKKSSTASSSSSSASCSADDSEVVIKRGVC